MSPLEIECPKCGSLPGAKCRTLKTGRTTDTHTARWDVIYDRARRALAAHRERHGLSGGQR